MFSSIFIDRPRFAVVIAIVITLAGAIAISAIPIAQFPEIVPPLDISNVMILCAKCNKPVRVGKKLLDDGTRVRVCKSCGEQLD